MNKTKLLIALCAAFFIAGCETETSTALEDSIVETTPETNGAVNPSARFDPSNSVIPFPNNLLFAGSTDGTINIPVPDATDLSNPQVALNALDGFSTVAPMTAEFSTAIDASTISGDTVRLYQVDLLQAGGPVNPAGTITKLTYGDTEDYTASISPVDSSMSTLVITPRKPLDGSQSYMLVITNGLMSSGGNAFGPSVTYRLIKSLSDPLVFCPDPTAASCTLPGALRSLTETELASFETLRLIVNTSEGAIAASDTEVETSGIILSWSFTTQSIGAILTKEQSDISGGAAVASFLVDSMTDSPLGAADIYVGTVDVPYYLTAASDINDRTPLESTWTSTGGAAITPLSPDAVATSTQSIPLMVSIPKPGGGNYPVVIYQHGITTNRATMLAVADSMAAAGMAVVAIDMPMHGLTGNEIDGTENFFEAAGASERTFNLDLVNNTTSAPVPDGITDTSGTHFINLTNLLNTRDNVRQAVSDLFTLTHALSTMSAGTSTFDTSRIYFLGHSLGAMVGTTFVALEPAVRDAAFAFGGGSYPKVLDGSFSFSPRIVAGLAAAGAVKGTTDYETFMSVAQAVVDTADPINHAESAATGRGIVYFEIVGGNSGSPSDLVVPNVVPDSNDTGNTVPAPLAGTEPVLTLMGLTQVNADDAGVDLKRSIKFVVGNHSSLLSAAADTVNTAATNTLVRTEIQTIAATFLASDGASIDVTDDTLLQAP